MQTITASVKDLRAKFGIPNATDANAKTGTATVTGTVELTKPPADAPEPQELFVDVHLATPYGVTSHLLIPALGKWRRRWG